MGNRWIQIAVVICWFASMSWLMVEKVFPLLREGDRPDYQSVLPAGESNPLPACWQLRWNEREIGWAVTRAKRMPDASARVRSLVRFERISLKKLLSELLGALGSALRLPQNSDAQLELSMTLASESRFDSGGKLRNFHTIIDASSLEDEIHLHGVVIGKNLKLHVYSIHEPGSDGKALMTQWLRDEIEIPADAVVADALSPRPRLEKLRVGQTWTFSTYQPLFPSNRLQLVQAKVEADEVFIWDDRPMRAFRVVYRRDAGSGISASRSPLGKLWVGHDGAVMQQEINFANLRFTFVRLPEEESRVKALLLDRHWPSTPNDSLP